MKEQNQKRININRRSFIASTAALTAGAMMPGSVFASYPGSTPDSNFNGVHIGAITYSYRGMPETADDLLKYLIKCGISSVELMGGPAEQFAGAPEFDGPPRPRGPEVTDKQRAEFRDAMEAHSEKVQKWRLTVSMDKYKQLRKKYNDAGVDIFIVKLGDIGPHMSEEEVNYCFKVAKALGAKGITTEISEEKAEFLGPYADKHEIMIGFHNHTQVNPQSWEKPFSYGKFLGMNFDVGHYVAGTNLSPIPIIEKYAAEGRILSLHIKDRKVNDGPNMPLGQGDTPVALILQLMKREKYPFPAHIELEYPVPEGSDAVEEVKKCVEYCKNVLMGPV